MNYTTARTTTLRAKCQEQAKTIQKLKSRLRHAELRKLQLLDRIDQLKMRLLNKQENSPCLEKMRRYL